MNVVENFFTKSLGMDSKPENIETKKNICTKDLGLDVDNRIFVNQCLIPAYRLLYNAAQNAKKAGKCKFVWISNGKILVRKHIGGKVTKLTSVNDLENL